MRTLRGAEARLFAAAVDVMIDELSMGLDDAWEEDPSWEILSGVSVFDCLTTSQRIALLHQVAGYLLTERRAPDEVSAAQEAAVAAVFSEIRDRVTMEIDLFGSSEVKTHAVDEDATEWRDQVLEAYRHVSQLEATSIEPAGNADQPLRDDAGDWLLSQEDERFEPPKADCRELDDWILLIESLTDSILWDRDFEMAESFLDADPGVSEQRRRLLGIPDDYFTQVAPDPQPAELPVLISQTRALVRAKPR